MRSLIYITAVLLLFSVSQDTGVNGSNLADHTINVAGSIAKDNPVHKTSPLQDAWAAALDVLEGGKIALRYVTGHAQEKKPVTVINLRSSSDKQAHFKKLSVEQGKAERKGVRPSASSAIPNETPQQRHLRLFQEVDANQETEDSIFISNRFNPLDEDGNIPPSDYNATFCSDVGYMWVFPQPDWTCGGEIVNKTTFEANCPTAVGLEDGDFESEQAETEWSEECGCTRSKAYSRLCVCPRDRIGVFCERARRVNCELTLSNDPPCDEQYANRYNTGKLDTDRACRPVRMDDLYTFQPQFRCEFTQTRLLAEGLNLTQSNILMKRKVNITQAELDVVHEGFEYWVDERGADFNFSVAINAKSRNFTTNLMVYDLDTFRRHSFQTIQWTPDHALGLAAPTFQVRPRDVEFAIRGQRLYIEIGAPVTELPSGLRRGVWQRIFLDPVDAPLPPVIKHGYSGWEIFGIVVGALVALTLVTAAAGVIWWRRAGRHRKSDASSYMGDLQAASAELLNSKKRQ